MTGSSLVKVDENGMTGMSSNVPMFSYSFNIGSIIDPGSTTFSIDPLSFSLYTSIYKHRPDIQCLIHLQTSAVTAVSAMKCGLLPLSQEALICGRATSHSINIDLETNRLAINDDLKQSNAKVI